MIDTPWAIEIGAENCLIYSDINLQYNSASGSYYGDFLAVGYSEVGFLNNTSIECNPLLTVDVSEGHGYVHRITVSENDFQATPREEVGTSVITLQFRLTYAVIDRSVVCPVNADGDGSATGDQNRIAGIIIIKGVSYILLTVHYFLRDQKNRKIK